MADNDAGLVLPSLSSMGRRVSGVFIDIVSTNEEPSIGRSSSVNTQNRLDLPARNTRRNSLPSPALMETKPLRQSRQSLTESKSNVSLLRPNFNTQRRGSTSSLLDASPSPTSNRRSSFADIGAQVTLLTNSALTVRSPPKEEPKGAFSFLTSSFTSSSKDQSQSSWFSWWGSKNEDASKKSKRSKTKLHIFLSCFFLGSVITLLSMFSLVMKRDKIGLLVFAALYMSGSIFALISALSLAPIVRHLKSLLEGYNTAIVILYMASLVLGFLGGYKINSPGVVFFAFIIQSLAIIWYSFSFIPNAKTSATLFFGKLF